jgi:serine/threonine protein kinase
MSSIDTTTSGTITSFEPSVVPTSVGIGSQIGKGTYKTVYSCIETDNVNNKIFTLPHDVSIDKLVIAVLDINKILFNNFSKVEQEFFDIYIKNLQKFIKMFSNETIKSYWEISIKGSEYTNNPALYFEHKLKEQFDKIKKEIELQNLFFENQLAPKIYEDRYDEDTKMFYILEEKCGIPLLTYIKEKTNQTEDNFNKIVELVTKIADTGYINVDIKPENTCTKFENGSLLKIIALDFDTEFFIKFDLTNEEIKEQGKIFMLTLFIAYLRKYNYITFSKVIVEKHLNYDKIKNMLTFFAGNPEICAKEMHPLFMLYHYIINETTTSSCSLHTPNIIETLTTKIYNLFQTEGGSRKSRRPRRSKKSKKSKKSRK